MELTKEDRIITAQEARERTQAGSDDSAVRKELRQIMEQIKIHSGYGYKYYSTVRPLHMLDQVKEILENLGYTCSSIEIIKEPTTHPYRWTIEW